MLSPVKLPATELSISEDSLIKEAAIVLNPVVAVPCIVARLPVTLAAILAVSAVTPEDIMLALPLTDALVVSQEDVTCDAAAVVEATVVVFIASVSPAIKLFRSLKTPLIPSTAEVMISGTASAIPCPRDLISSQPVSTICGPFSIRLLISIEMISNPALQVLDVATVSKIAHDSQIPLFVDSTTATPFIIKPISYGADVVIHSTSKYLNGGGNSIGGVIVDGGKFAWDTTKHTALAEFKKYGKFAFLVRLRTDIWENLGGCMAPMNAFLSCIGLDTLGLRMERICNNADKLAKALSELEGIEVNYLTLGNHPYHDYVEKELKGYGGGILTFRAGSKERAFRIINSLQYALIASNIGDIRTLVIHPASTLYLRTDKEETEAAGVFEDTIRISVGIEDSEDLIRDFVSAVKESVNA